MTVNQLIKELQSIVKEDNLRGELEVYMYFDDPYPIGLIDNSISDRIDINI